MQAHRSIAIRELKEHTREIIREVREKGVVIDITVRGRVVARLLPVHSPQPSVEERTAIWSDLDRLAAEIGASWPRGVSAAEAVQEARRAL